MYVYYFELNKIYKLQNYIIFLICKILPVLIKGSSAVKTLHDFLFYYLCGMKTEERFVKFLSEVCGVGPESTVLLAVSGGLDSMVMLHLFMMSGFKIVVGHINHGLRALESDHDFLFVKNFCEDNNIPFYSENIPKGYWGKGNLQQLARDFRYKKLNEWKEESQAEFIATAHHLDDSLETSLMYFWRGTGLHGLTGITPKEKCIIRPLSIFSRKELESFVTLNQIAYREDSSNATDKYKRNYIRNKVLPAFDGLEAKNRQGFYQTLSNVRKSLTLLDVLVKKYCDDYIFYEKDYIKIDADGFKKFSHPDLLLFHFLSDYGFAEVQIHQILENRKPGKVFLSKTYVLTIQNDSWTLRKKEMTLISESTQPFEFPSPGKFYIGENEWEVSFLPISPENRLFGVSVEKLSFPLFVRPWSPKDIFRPVQMKGSAKSIKKLLSEQKIPIENRKNKMVLADANGVILALEGGFVDYNNCTNIPGQCVLSITKNGQKIF